MFIINKLVVIFVTAFVIVGGRTVVEWICMNVLNLEYETTDKIAFYYVTIATLVLIVVLSRWWLLRRRAY